ncbi:unnamed protein product [Urochloa decumbens]|uniref:Exocyst subunit Exo70 family protein n=1 Tax=Urochloa decumbens TaxID=240449 RepID=A0ABC9B8B8_9POAL
MRQAHSMTTVAAPGRTRSADFISHTNKLIISMFWLVHMVAPRRRGSRPIGAGSPSAPAGGDHAWLQPRRPNRRPLRPDQMVAYAYSTSGGTSGTLSTTYDTSSRGSLARELDQRVEHDEEKAKRRQRAKGVVQEFCQGDGDIGALERWLSEMGVGWVLGLADNASAGSRLLLRVHRNLTEDWIRALTELTGSTLRFVREQDVLAGQDVLGSVQLVIKETVLKMLPFVDALLAAADLDATNNRAQAPKERLQTLLCVSMALSSASSDIKTSLQCRDRDSSVGMQTQRRSDEVLSLVSATMFFRYFDTDTAIRYADTLIRQLSKINYTATRYQETRDEVEVEKFPCFPSWASANGPTSNNRDMTQGPSNGLGLLLSQFSHCIASFIHGGVNGGQHELDEAIWSTMEEVKTGILNDDNKWDIQTPQGKPDICMVTRSLVTYIKFLWGDYYWLVDHIVQTAAELGNYVPEQDKTNPLVTLAMEMVYSLQVKINERSESFPDHSLRFLFLINNIHFIWQQLHPLFRMKFHMEALATKIEEYIQKYLQVSWEPVLSCLYNHKPRCFRKNSALPKFNSEFQKTYAAQKLWKVPDPKLRTRLRKAIVEKVVSGLTRYLEDNNVTNPVVTPQEREEMLLELFEG